MYPSAISETGRECQGTLPEHFLTPGTLDSSHKADQGVGMITTVEYLVPLNVEGPRFIHFIVPHPFALFCRLYFLISRAV